MIANIFGLFKVTDYKVAMRMTLYEYNLRMKGYAVATVEEEYKSYFNAFVDRQVKSTGKDGKYIYKQLKDVYSKEKRLKEILGNKLSNPDLIRIAENLKQARKRGVISE